VAGPEVPEGGSEGVAGRVAVPSAKLTLSGFPLLATCLRNHANAGRLTDLVDQYGSPFGQLPLPERFSGSLEREIQGCVNTDQPPPAHNSIFATVFVEKRLFAAIEKRGLFDCREHTQESNIAGSPSKKPIRAAQ
jgi:hypothetical protein